MLKIAYRLPTFLSLCRIVAALFFCYFSLTHLGPWKKLNIAIIIFAALTDFLDGYIARRFKCITKFGIYIDPLTDKIFTVFAFLSLSFNSNFQRFLIAAIVIREIYSIFLRTIYFPKKNFAAKLKPNIYGKLKTCFEFFLLLFYLVSPLNDSQQRLVIDITLLIIIMLAYYSICIYTLRAIRKKV